MKALHFIKVFFKNLKYDNCFNNAALIAYFSLLSAVPLLFLITTTIGFLTGSNQVVVKKIYVLINPYLPNITYEFWLKITGWFAKSSYTLNLFSIVILIVSSTLVFSSIDKSLRDIFKDFGLKKRSSLEAFLIYFLLIIFLVFIVFVFMFFDVSVGFLKHFFRNKNVIILKDFFKKSVQILYFFSIILQIVTISFILSISIGKKLVLKKLIFASSFIVFMWSLAIKAFSWYVSVVPTYNLVYGSMSIFIIFMTWNYYSALIFLAGAVILKMITKND